MSIRLFALIIIFTITGLCESACKRNGGRRAGEFENAICEPSKRHLDLDGCGECICNTHGYGSVCEKVYCPKVYKRSIDDRECTPYEDFQTQCHYCKCSSGGIPIDCEEKYLNCMDKMVERLKIGRFRETSVRRTNRRIADRIYRLLYSDENEK